MCVASVRIRELTIDDAEALLAFYRSLSEAVVWFYQPFREPDLATMVDHLTGGSDGRRLIQGIVNDEGHILGHGFILGSREPEPVFGIGLHQDIHGQGWGRRLMESVLAKADDLGLPLVTLTVVKTNLRAIRLYERLGYRTHEYIEGYYRPTEDRVIMRRAPHARGL